MFNLVDLVVGPEKAKTMWRLFVIYKNKSRHHKLLFETKEKAQLYADSHAFLYSISWIEPPTG